MTETYYVHIKSSIEDRWQEVEGEPVRIKGLPDEEFFVHPSLAAPGWWKVSHARTGASVLWQVKASKTKAIWHARRNLRLAFGGDKERLIAMCRDEEAKHGTSPRYATMPGVPEPSEDQR